MPQVLPLAALLPARGLLVVTVKLGRRGGEGGLAVKLEAAAELLAASGFSIVRQGTDVIS